LAISSKQAAPQHSVGIVFFICFIVRAVM
jgi:hypothetical protein